MSVEMERSSTSSREMNADSALPGPRGVGPLGQKLSRRSLVARATFFGTAMAAEVAEAQDGGSGSYSNAAIALPDDSAAAQTREEQIRAVKIARAMRAGPPAITEHATVAEMDALGRMTQRLEKRHQRLGLHARQRGCRRRSANVRRSHWACSGSRIYVKGRLSPPTRRLGSVTCCAAQRSISNTNAA